MSKCQILAVVTELRCQKTLFHKCIAAFKNKKNQGPGAHVITYMPVKIIVDTRQQIYNL